MNRLLRWTIAVHACIQRLAPPAADVLDDDTASTLRSVLRAAYERRGVMGACWAATREIADVIVAVGQARFESWRAVRQSRPGVGGAAWRRDLRMAARGLWASRPMTAIAVATLALGIGINAAMFSLLTTLLWRPVPFPDADRLIEVWNYSTAQKFSYSGASHAALDQWRAQRDLFVGVEGYTRAQFVYDGPQGAEMVPGATVTPGLIDLLGVRPAAGRALTGGDAVAGASPVVVVSHRCWVERLGRPSDLANVTVSIDGRPHRVVGVMPRTFRFPSAVEDLWVPADASTTSWVFTPVARMAPDMRSEAIDGILRARGSQVLAAVNGPADVTAQMSPLGTRFDERTRTSLFVLAAAVGCLFLVVCVNVANLVLARALRRSSDVATCIALGASRGALLRTVVFEQTLLAGTGALLGGAVAGFVLRLAQTTLPESMTAASLQPLQLDWQTWIFLAAGGMLAAVLSALAPAWLATRGDGAAALGRERAGTGSRTGRRWRAALVVAEVAMSIVLLVGAALMTRSFVALATEHPGFDPRGLLTLEVGFPAATYAEPARRQSTVMAVAERLRSVPHVRDVAVGTLPSDTRLIAFSDMEFSNRPGETVPRNPIPMHEVSHDYFSVMDLPIVAGRSFRPDDEDALIVNSRFARRYFQTETPVGLRMRLGNGRWRTVVGVAGDTLADRERGTQRVEMFVPLGEATDAFRPGTRATTIAEFRTLMIRTSSPALLARQLTDAVHAEDSSIVAWKTTSVERVLADALARPRVVLAAMAVCALSGLVLAMVGLYGVLSHLVAQRRREIGVRLALGADRHVVQRLVYRQGLFLTLIGCGLGLAAAWPLTRLLKSLLFDVGATDPLAIGGAGLLMILTALAASWWPAREASQLDPAALLRGE